MNKNPIFIEYYSHLKCDCYKIKNPFTSFAEEKFVLCPVENGIDDAVKIAKAIIEKNFLDSLTKPIVDKE